MLSRRTLLAFAATAAVLFAVNVNGVPSEGKFVFLH